VTICAFNIVAGREFDKCITPRALDVGLHAMRAGVYILVHVCRINSGAADRARAIQHDLREFTRQRRDHTYAHRCLEEVKLREETVFVHFLARRHCIIDFFLCPLSFIVQSVDILIFIDDVRINRSLVRQDHLLCEFLCINLNKCNVY
jgi:hypothetical protein